MANVDEVPSAPKAEQSEEGSFSDTSPEVDEQSFVPENAQVQKRKGGRKPVRNGFTRIPNSVLNPSPDICYFGGKKAEKPSSSSGIQRTPDGIHQAVGDDH